jgi:hypothetical protein
MARLRGQVSYCSISLACGLAAFLIAAARINHGLVDSWLPAGPGLTVDESFNIQQGVYLVDALAQHGPLLFTPSVAREVFAPPDYLPDHPPLGRLLLGLAHESTSWLIAGAEDSAFNVPAARLGSCFAFALTVLLLSEFARRRSGWIAAILSSSLLIGMPHALGHARLAALESATILAWFAALLPLLAWWTGTAPPKNRQAIVSGVLWGLLLLTKVQGVLLPPVVGLWAVWQYRRQSVRPLLLWTLAGVVVFFACWPWLWSHPWDHATQYLGRTVDRTTLYCWYFGERYADRDVPWHYPFVMTAASLPIAFLICAAGVPLRFLRRAESPLLMLSVFVPLLIFAIPGTPVYDGTRLFSVIFPALTLLVGPCPGETFLLIHSRSTTDTDSAATAEAQTLRPWLKSLLVLSLTAMALEPAMHIVSLPQYGPLAGGQIGTATENLEVAYWSEALNGDFWSQLPEGSTIYVAPVSHQFQLSDFESLVPVVRQRRLKLEPFLYDSRRQRGLLLLLHRFADLRPSLRSDPDGAGDVAAAMDSRGRIFARVIDTTNATWQEIADWPTAR